MTGSRSTPGTQRPRQIEARRRALPPFMFAEWRLPVRAVSEVGELVFAVRVVDVARPLHKPIDRSSCQEGGRAPLGPQSQARPRPLLGAGHQVRSQGIPLYITKDLQEVMILLDWKGLESSLPQASGRPVAPVMSANMRGE